MNYLTIGGELWLSIPSKMKDINIRILTLDIAPYNKSVSMAGIDSCWVLNICRVQLYGEGERDGVNILKNMCEWV